MESELNVFNEDIAIWALSNNASIMNRVRRSPDLILKAYLPLKNGIFAVSIFIAQWTYESLVLSLNLLRNAAVGKMIQPTLASRYLSKLVSRLVLPILSKGSYSFLVRSFDKLFRDVEVEVYEAYYKSSCQLAVTLELINESHILDKLQPCLPNFPYLNSRSCIID